MPLQATSGAASYDAFGGGVAAVPNYIENVFSTYLYTSDGTTQTITNGIDLSTYGGMVWIKNRSAAQNHYLSTTTLGIQNTLTSNNTGGLGIGSDIVHSVTTTGFTAPYNFNIGENLASWTFRKQPKFFDVVTWTGTGSTQNIAHNLGSTPGCIIVKCTSSATGWAVYHRGIGATNYLVLNSTAASAADIALWNNTSPTSTQFTVGTDAWVNSTGFTYVAYLYAHNAGGFGLTGTDNVISCGSFTTNGSGQATVNLGYEPQFLLMKATDASNWWMFDNMRNWSKTGFDELNPNLSAGESNYTSTNFSPTATGFQLFGNEYGASRTFIYIAIRRGPMKVPTSGTSVFSPSTYTGDDGSNREITGLSFTPDLMLNAMRLENGSGRSPSGFYWFDRLRGKGARLRSSQTLAEFLVGPAYEGVNFRSYSVDAASGESNYNPALYVSHLFKRAPSFMDVVCYSGTGSAITIPHNLTVKPELIIQKCRNTVDNWHTFTALDGWARLNSANAWDDTAYGSGINTIWQATTTTVALNSTFAPFFAASASTYVIYLFASCPGVSKVGSYTGNGTTQTINCGFTGGARFVLIKRTDSAGGWYVYDTARGMTVLTDPYLFLNSTAAESATLGSVTTVSTGFALNSTILAAINVSGGSYIFLAIA